MSSSTPPKPLGEETGPQEFDIEDEGLADSPSSPELLTLLPYSGLEDSVSALLPSAPKAPKTNQLNLWSACSLLIGSQIGSGIFSSPSQIDRNVSSPGAAICVWIACGLLAWTGAASFAELGTTIPVNGGVQEYLAYIYGDLLASLSSWIAIIAVRPCAMAILSLIFAEYWTKVFLPPGTEHLWLDKMLALAVLFVVFLVNVVSTGASIKVTDLISVVKLLGLFLVIVVALLVAVFGINGDGMGPSTDWRSRNWFAHRDVVNEGANLDWDTVSNWGLIGYSTTAMYAGLWAYSGWITANSVTEEMKDVSRDLPRAIHLAMPTVIASFVLANIAYYIVLPWETIQRSNAVAVALGDKAVGNIGGIIFAIIVSISCLGSLNINLYVTPILTVAAAQRGYLPRILLSSGNEKPFRLRDRRPRESYRYNKGWIKSTIGRFQHFATMFAGNRARANIPLKALICNTLLGAIFILIGSFGTLTTFIEITDYLFYALTTLGLLILRWKEPTRARPYKTSLFNVIVFTTVSFLLVARGLLFSPIQGAVLALLLIVGGLLHWHKTRSEKA